MKTEYVLPSHDEVTLCPACDAILMNGERCAECAERFPKDII